MNGLFFLAKALLLALLVFYLYRKGAIGGAGGSWTRQEAPFSFWLTMLVGGVSVLYLLAQAFKVMLFA
ncbi:hypothetical protein AAKU55_001689 [Oxalobacteraceae bacterium GrIS 1.11]